MIAQALRSWVDSQEIKHVKARGNSMCPEYYSNETINLLPLSGKYRNGQCFAFWTSNGMVIHRLVHQKQGMFIFIGDNNFEFETIGQSDLIAKAQIGHQSTVCARFISILNTIFIFRSGNRNFIALFLRFQIFKVVKCIFGKGGQNGRSL